MTWAGKRKLIYFSGFILVIGILVGTPLVLFFYKAPTCFDGKQNGTEQGIDCAGSCVKLCKPLELEPVVLWQQDFKVAPGVYTAVAYVQNPNLNAEAKLVPYTFKLYDSKNVVISERKGTVYIPPGKNFAVFESGIKTAENVPEHVSFDFTGEFNWQSARAGLPQLVIKDPLLSNASTSPSVDVDIQNPTLNPINRVNLTAIIYDLAGNAVAASKTYISNLDRQSSQHIVFTWPYSFPQLAVACEVPADVILSIDRSGSMAADKKNPPEPLTTVKNAASYFIDQLKGKDQVGFVSFATNASTPIDHILSNNFTDVKNSIQAVSIAKNGTQYTNIDDAITSSTNELSSNRHNPNSKRVIVLLTDGEATYPEKKGDPQYASNQALCQVQW